VRRQANKPELREAEDFVETQAKSEVPSHEQAQMASLGIDEGREPGVPSRPKAQVQRPIFAPRAVWVVVSAIGAAVVALFLVSRSPAAVEEPVVPDGAPPRPSSIPKASSPQWSDSI
jgi:hypothetical protein